MPDQGVDLGVDLYKLLVVAKDNLPSVAAVYSEAVSKYESALGGVAGAMTRPDHFGGALGPVYQSWVSLHTVAAKVLSDTESSLEATALSLSQAIDLYASTDQAAAAEFKRLREVNGEPSAG
ncbi:MAG: hypothetical protein M3443_09670 [Actinomycetota bacterium]|nr:hypothetical protein [Actinomycetota bacterium]